MKRLLATMTLCVSMLTQAASAVELGDKEKGHEYARKFCAECHGVEKEEFLLLGDVPTFYDVANSEGMSARALAVWLRTSHPNMPDFIIPADDIDNVIAYIMSLRAPKE